MLIDSHIHLQDKKYELDTKHVITQAVNHGVRTLIVPGTDLASSFAAINLAETFSTTDCAIYAAVGIHPTDAHTLTPDVLSTLDEIATHPRVIAIGEIGLDYYWVHNANRSWRCATIDEQTIALEAQLELAQKHALPVILHDRDAHNDIIAVIESWQSKYPQGSGTFHAYAGGRKHLDRVMATGMCIGMDGPITYKNAHSLRQVAQAVPLNRLLLETDGPYLTPAPHRGKRNIPAYIPLIRDAIADTRQCSPDQIEQATSVNAKRLFNLPDCNTPMV